MSAAAAPYGMVPVENYGAAYNTQGFDTFTILDGYTTSIFFGDVVKLASDGTIQKDTGTSTLAPFGIFLGCRYVNPTLGYVLDAQCWPASLSTSNTVYAKILTNPWGLFQIQANGSVALTDLGSNAAIVQTAGSLTIGKSRNALGAIATTDTLPLKIVGFLQSPTNAPGDAFTDVLVTFNNTQQILTKLGV